MRPLCERCAEAGWGVLAFYPREAPTRCADCQDAYNEAADAHMRERWHGGNGPQSDRERDEVRR
jgi:hypothetical protein